MQERMDIFTHETLRVIKHFEALGKVIKINAEGDIDTAQTELRQQLGL